MNSLAIIIVAALALVLLIFLIRQNMKDQRQLTDQLNRDYRHSKEEEGDTEIDEVKK